MKRLLSEEIRKHTTGKEHQHAPDFELDKYQGAEDVGQGVATEVEDAGRVPDEELYKEADLMTYFTAFKSVFNLYHKTGRLDIVLYDPTTGEVLLPDE